MDHSLSIVLTNKSVAWNSYLEQSLGIVAWNRVEVNHLSEWMCSIALGKNPSVSRSQAQSVSYLLLGKLLISTKLCFITFLIQQQIYPIRCSFDKCKMKTQPCSFLIFRVQNSISVASPSLSCWFYAVLKTMTPQSFEYSQFSSTSAAQSIEGFSCPLNFFSISLRMLMIFPFLTTCLGSLLKNYSLDGGLKSLFSLDSKVVMDSPELQSLYFSATLSKTLKKTPLGYFPLRTQGKYPSTKSPRIWRDSFDLQGKNLQPLIASPLLKKPRERGSAFRNLWTPFSSQTSVPMPSECSPELSSSTLLRMVLMSISEGSRYWLLGLISFFIFSCSSFPSILFPTHFSPYFLRQASISTTFCWSSPFSFCRSFIFSYSLLESSLNPFKNRFSSFSLSMVSVFYQISFNVP